MASGYLADKYAILGSQAHAANVSAAAQQLSAQSNAAEVASRNALMGGQESVARATSDTAIPAAAGEARARGNLAQKQADWVGPQAQAGIGLMGAQGSEAVQRGSLYGSEAGRIGAMIPSEIAASRAATARTGAETGVITRGQDPLLGGGGINPTSTDADYYAHQQPYTAPSTPTPQEGYAKGTSKVPTKGAKGKPLAKGAGMVPSKLAPGEAVLNPGAAEHMGRGLIGALNMMSNHGALSSQQPHLGGSPHAAVPQSIGSIPMGAPSAAMGQVPGAAGPASGGAAPLGPQGFAGGSGDVEPKSAIHAKDPDEITEEAGQASGDNGVRAFAKGSSNVQTQPDSIGQNVKLQNSKMGGKPTPDLSLAKGTTKVPGKPTKPSKDTVGADIPPGGAVLTNDAANHVGRGLIAHLNAMHAMPVGMPPAGNAPMMGGGRPPPGFAGGTPNVPPPPPPPQEDILNRIARLGFAEGTSFITSPDGRYLPNPNAPQPSPASRTYNDLSTGAQGLYQGGMGLVNASRRGYNELGHALNPTANP